MLKKTGSILAKIEMIDLLTELNSIEYEVITTNKKISYINLEVAFDIEVTSTYLADGNKSAFMYVWMIGFKNSDFVYFGRTWDEFVKFMDILQKFFGTNYARRLVIYVHNLGYEFQFMKDYLEWEEVFSVEVRKPIKALTTTGIEFRDSYILSGMALSRVAKNLTKHKVKKLVGNLEYDLIRHSGTELTELEIDYCVNDILIVLYYINEQMEIYGNIAQIPMTNTGRVRRYVRNECYYGKSKSKGRFWRYRRLMEDLVLTPEVYSMLSRAFMGGFTHANANYVGQVLEDVTSIDFTSSYPAVMLTEKFPMSKPIPTEITEEYSFDYYRRRFCLLFEARFINIRCKITQDSYISESKCWKLEKPIVNNGRIQSADLLCSTITDVDFEIIEQVYEWDSMEVANVYRFHKGYLPKAIIDCIVNLYEDKTVLKGVEGKEVEYVLSKGMLNSIYGMCVTAVVRDTIVYDGKWETFPADVEEQIDDYNKSFNRFLYYPWGIWVTAYARRNLWYGIISMGDDYVYADTDSIKFLNYDKHKPFIEWYNNMIEEKLKKICSLYKIPFNRMKPKTQEGVVALIGVWDLDGQYSRFKTLGAKRYLVEHKATGELELTVAGLSKSNGLEYMKRKCNNDNSKVFEMFDDELYIPAEETGKNTHTYIDTPQDYMIMDYQGKEGRAEARSSVHLEKAEFTLSLARQYVHFIEQLKKGYLYTGQKIV